MATTPLSNCGGVPPVQRVPVTILSGFLGSGKTTLLNHILTATHGKKIAIVENEFGEVAIDDALIATQSRHVAGEGIVAVLNGCVCCTVREDLIDIIRKLGSRYRAGELSLDAIVIETTGMADPMPVAQSFLMDAVVREFTRLDGIVCLVDVKHIEQHLDETKPAGTVNEAAAQVGFADRILLNKIDLASWSDVDRVEARLRAMNPCAPIERCTHCNVSVDSVLNIHGFDLQRTLTTLPNFLNATPAVETKHDPSITSVSLNQGAARHLRTVRAGELDLGMFQEWLRELLASRGKDIFRVKGVLAVAHADVKYVCHAVHMTFMAAFDEPWSPDERRESKLVFIGKGLDKTDLAAAFNRCLATPQNYANRAAKLRFAVGEQVDFLSDDGDGWVGATVTRHHVRDDDYMEPGMVAPYQIQRHDFPPGWFTWAERDEDSCIRRKGSAPMVKKASTKRAAVQKAGEAAEKLEAHPDYMRDHMHGQSHEDTRHEHAHEQAHDHAHEHTCNTSEGWHAAEASPRPAADAEAEARELNEQRLRANQMFGAGDFVGAAEAYTHALSVLGMGEGADEHRRADAARFLANRAACRLKLQQASQALADAKQAVEMDPTYDKAHFRLAHALQGVGRRSEAHESMKKVRELRAAAASRDAVVGGASDAAAAAVVDLVEADVTPSEDERVKQIVEVLKPTLAGSELRRALVEQLHELLSTVSQTGSDAVQSATARAFADAKGPQVLWEMESSMRGNWVADAKNGTMSRISKIFELPGAVCKAAINYRKRNGNKQAAAMCTFGCSPDDECCWAAGPR